MSATRQADTRRPASIRESASRGADELAWPPSSDDLNAIDVVPMAACATELHTHTARVQGPPRSVPKLPSLPELLAVHDVAGVDADTFRSEAVHGPAAVDSLLPTTQRARSWTRLALYTAAAVVVVSTSSPFMWMPGVSPELPQVAEVTSTVPRAAPLAPVWDAAVRTPANDEPRASAAVPVEPPQAADGAPEPATVPAPPARPATPREPAQFVPRPESQRAMAPASQRVLVPESQRVLEPASQRVLQPDAQPARPVETMARSAVPVVVPPGALPTREMASTPASPARIDEVGVQAALRRYEAAYSRLDARAAQAVWPSVDAGALARAFENLESQSLQFDRCALDVRETVARVDCLGSATYVRRIGSRAPRTESRAWTFNLRKTGDAWLILSAAAR